MPGAVVSCFVIGPIGNEHAPPETPPRTAWEKAIEVYEKIIQPACALEELTTQRADEISAPGEIDVQIFTRLRDVDLVIADLTDANPNVMYELGLRHSVDLPVIAIGEFGALPFDVRTIRTIEFSRTPRGLVDAREKLRKAIQSLIAGEWETLTPTRIIRGARVVPAAWPDRPSVRDRLLPMESLPVPTENPAERPAEADETAPKDLAVEQLPEAGGTTRRDVAVDQVEADQPLGFLELLADMESAFPQMVVTAEKIGEVIKEIGSVAVLGTNEINENRASGGGARGVLVAAGRFAERLDSPATSLEKLVSDYEDQMRRADAGMNYILSTVEAEPNRLSELGEFPNVVHKLADNAEAAFSSADGLVRSMDGIAPSMRAVAAQTGRIGAAIRRMTASRAVIRAWSDRLRAAADRPQPPASTRMPPQAGRPESRGRRPSARPARSRRGR